MDQGPKDTLILMIKGKVKSKLELTDTEKDILNMTSMSQTIRITIHKHNFMICKLYIKGNYCLSKVSA